MRDNEPTVVIIGLINTMKPEKKWPLIRRWHFSLIQILLKFVPKEQFENKSWLVQVKANCTKDDPVHWYIYA